MSTLITDIATMRRESAEHRRSGRRIGVVPTMGALHEGHLALIREARRRSDIVITTIFVNPAQFGPSEDFGRYPRDLERDILLAADAGTDFVFAPAAEDMYPAGYRTYVQVTGLEEVLEGKSRPGHFRGVATVVLKLLQACLPHCALFGQKDAQQVIVIRRMVEDLNLDVDVVVVPTVRESDGLAMSSRNVYLTGPQRKEAPVLYRSLLLGERKLREGAAVIAEVKSLIRGEITGNSTGIVDYISIADVSTLEELAHYDHERPVLISLAVRFGATRLIDNVIVPAAHSSTTPSSPPP